MRIRRDNIIEDYHGVAVADPFRWLEDPDSSETADFITQQNRQTRSFLDTYPGRAEIRSRITELWDYTKYGVPHKKGDTYFYLRNDGMQNQAVLYYTQSLNGTEKVAVDPNEFSDDGTVALTSYTVSKDGRYLAYTQAASGSDWQEVRVKDLDTNEHCSDVIKWCKFTTLPWLPDSSGFFYSRYPKPGTVPEEDASRYNKVYLHKLGTKQEDDILAYERPDNKDLAFRPGITSDGNYLYLHVSHGTDPRNRFYFKKLNSDGDFVRLLDEHDAMYHLLGNDGDVFYFLTNYHAPKRRIIAIDIKKPARENWVEVVMELNDVISQAVYVGGHFALAVMHDAYHLVKVFNKQGRLVKEVTLPTLGAVTELSAQEKDNEFYFDFASFLYPTTIFRFDLSTMDEEMLWTPEVAFNAQDFTTSQVFYKSKDGTKVPMFITHKKGIALDGTNPTLLYSYGGFNASRIPEFKVPDIVWLERGGVFAVANLRGGSEYGEEWHQAGMLEKKQNVFDDFIAAAEWLIANQYTDRKHLAIKGRSNGGLLTAACMVQRPDLYGAVISQVPVIDMLRYHRFTVGRFWIPEYGDAESNAEHFKFLYAYSPLHNVRYGVVYPPIMLMTAKTDDRVVPAHAMKMTATLQDIAISTNPILLRVEEKAGHGPGKPTHKLIDEQADMYAFIDKLVNIK